MEDIENAAEDEENSDADERQMVAEQSGDPQQDNLIVAATTFDQRSSPRDRLAVLVRRSPRMMSTECEHHCQSGEHESHQDGVLADDDAVMSADRRAEHH